MAAQAWMAAAASVVLVAALELWTGPLGVVAAAGLLAGWGAIVHRHLAADAQSQHGKPRRPAMG